MKNSLPFVLILLSVATPALYLSVKGEVPALIGLISSFTFIFGLERILRNKEHIQEDKNSNPEGQEKD